MSNVFLPSQNARPADAPKVAPSPSVKMSALARTVVSDATPPLALTKGMKALPDGLRPPDLGRVPPGWPEKLSARDPKKEREDATLRRPSQLQANLSAVLGARAAPPALGFALRSKPSVSRQSPRVPAVVRQIESTVGLSRFLALPEALNLYTRAQQDTVVPSYVVRAAERLWPKDK